MTKVTFKQAQKRREALLQTLHRKMEDVVLISLGLAKHRPDVAVDKNLI